MIDIQKKVVVVLGAYGLLGKEIAHSIENNGGIVIQADINSDEFFVDITSKDSLLKLIQSVAKKYGKIDAVINSAYPRNKHYGNHFFDVTYEDFCENINLNLGGYFLATQQFASFFKQQGYGNIINIASIYGVIAPKFEIYTNTQMTMPVEYAAIKSGLIHLSKYIAKYLKGSNIRVNCISPGGIFDNQNNTFVQQYNAQCLTTGMLDKDDICGTILFLLSDISKHINGQNIIIDDGFTL